MAYEKQFYEQEPTGDDMEIDRLERELARLRDLVRQLHKALDTYGPHHLLDAQVNLTLKNKLF